MCALTLWTYVSEMNVALDQQSFDNPQQSRNDLLRVCRIGKAQGLKGEVTVQIFTKIVGFYYSKNHKIATMRKHLMALNCMYMRKMRKNLLPKMLGILRI